MSNDTERRDDGQRGPNTAEVGGAFMGKPARLAPDPTSEAMCPAALVDAIRHSLLDRWGPDIAAAGAGALPPPASEPVPRDQD